MKIKPLFTIGYSGTNFDDFVKILKRHEIGAVADVRSQPYSRFSPDFCKKDLEVSLPVQGVKYVFLGRELGARREETECYLNGRIVYSLVEKTSAFREGVDRLLDGVRKKHLTVALLCAEKDPVDCHRFVLVSHHLKKHLTDIRHIIGDKVESNAQTEVRLLAKYKKINRELFRSDEEILEDVYQIHGERIAYDSSSAESEATQP